MARLDASDAIYWFSGVMVVALVVILGFLVVLGLLNAVVVITRTLLRRKPEPDQDGCLPQGIIAMQPYLQLLADVLLVVVGIELIETLAAFLQRENPKVYLSGVLGAALVATARHVVVLFNIESPRKEYGEVYAYAALIAVLAAAYAAIRVFG